MKSRMGMKKYNDKFLFIILVVILIMLIGISKLMQYFVTPRNPTVTYESIMPISSEVYDIYALIGDYDIPETKSVYVYSNGGTTAGRSFIVTQDNAPKLFEGYKKMIFADSLEFQEIDPFSEDTYSFWVEFKDSAGQVVNVYIYNGGEIMRVNNAFYQLVEKVDVTIILDCIRAGFGHRTEVRDLEE